jgi:hypothetical protein
VTWAAMWAPSINRFVQLPYGQQFAAQRALTAFSLIRHPSRFPAPASSQNSLRSALPCRA